MTPAYPQSNPSDAALLDAWAARRDREAIGLLIRRHIDFVHAVARRRLAGDSHLADDVTQAVFILLLRKCPRITGESAMTGWLYSTANFAAANALKLHRRRRRHEEQGAQLVAEYQQSIPSTDRPDLAAESADQQALLHEAVANLARTDRMCVIMNCLQEKTHGEVAEAMGMSPEAVRKRVTRGIDRMRQFLISRGVDIPAAGFVAHFALKPVPVSPALVHSVMNVAILSHTTSQAATIAGAVNKMFWAARLKIAASVLGTLLVGGLVAGQAVRILGGAAVAPIAQQVALPAPATQPAAAAPGDGVVDHFTADLGDGVLVQFVGISPFDRDDWHDLDGNPIDAPAIQKNRMRMNPAPKFRALVTVDAPPDDAIHVQPTANGGFGIANFDQKNYVITFTPPDDAKTTEITVDVADSPWKTVMTAPFGNPDAMIATGGTNCDGSFSALVDKSPTDTMVFASLFGVNDPMRMLAIAKNGDQVAGENKGGAMSNKTNIYSCQFHIARDQVREIQVQTRGYSKRVVAKNICIDWANPSPAKIEIEKP